MILADSSVWIDYFNGASNWETDFLDNELAVTPVLMGDLILTEVLQGFRKEADYRVAKQKLLQLTIVPIGGREISLKAADNFRFLRHKGAIVRKTIDCIIATFCIEEQIPLLHRDRDFRPFVKYLGLRTPNPRVLG